MTTDEPRETATEPVVLAREPVVTEPADEPEAEQTIAEAVREQLGGVRGMVESSIPLMVFVVVNMATSLKPALWASVGSAVAIAVFRLARRDSVRHAVNGLLAVGVAALIAARTGRAEDFYLVAIVRNAAIGTAFVISAAIRRPLVGYAWSFVVGAAKDWRSRARLLRMFTLLTLMWAVVFAVRFGVQITLYLANKPDALGVVSLLMGWPLFAAAFALTVWQGRKAVAADDAARDEQDTLLTKP